MRHLIPCRDTTTAEELARLYVKHVGRHHGLPKTIITDRGSTFTSRFWKAVCKEWGTELKFSTAFHPQTDGQTERFNAIMEQYLRSYVNYLQDDWVDRLPLAEFAANNQASETIGISPFFANYGYDPRWTDEPVPNIKGNDDNDNSPEARTGQVHAETMKEINEHLRNEMLRAQQRHQDSANGRRLPEPIFDVGERVWLDARNITTQRPSRKLDHKRLGPFPIAEFIPPNSYRLELPDTMKNHPTYHVSLLERVAEDPFPGQLIPPPPPVMVDDKEEYIVEEVLDSRIRWKRLQYLITSWKRWIASIHNTLRN